MKHLLWVFVSAVFFLAASVNFLINDYRLRGNFNRARQQLMLAAKNAALSINTDNLLSIPLERSGDSAPEYQEIFQILQKIKSDNPRIKYVYIMAVTSRPGILQYVVDANPVPRIITAHCPSSLPGDKYDARNFPEMLSAFNGPAADKKITSDVWGALLSGYAPIYDFTGKPVAILGVDTDATEIQEMQKNTRISGAVASVTFLVFISSLAVLSIRKGQVC